MTSKLFDDKGRLKVSASQIQSFQNCPNFWFINKVQGHQTKITPALAYGSKFHSCIEKTYELLDEGVDLGGLKKSLRKLNKYGDEHIDMAIAGWQNKILINPPKKLIEKSIKVPIGDYGIMRGFIDFYNVNKNRIEDHKTIGDWKWAVKQEELKDNLQLMIYCYWAMRKLPTKKEIVVRHNQFFKKDPDQSQFIEDVVSRDYVYDYWAEHVEKTVSVMVEYVKELPDDYMELDIEKNPKHCGAYGGCCFLNEKCDGKED
jgi:hypothetical protein